MKQEELKKDYILLSKIAKEKKYAQEYLGLLARRGDIGSIRIGKRWYTTREWFSEFLDDAEAKKAEMKIAKTESAPVEFNISEKIEIAKVFSPVAERIVLHKFSGRNELEKNVSIRQGNVQEGKQEAVADLKNNMKLPDLTHGVSRRFFGGAESPEAEKGSISPVPPRQDGFLRRGIKLEKSYAREERAVPEKTSEAKIEIRKTKVEPIVSVAKHLFQARVRKNFETIDLVKKTDSGSSQSVRIKNNSFIRPQYVSDISGGAGLRKISREKIAAPQNIPARNLNGAVNANMNAPRMIESQKPAREEKPLREWKFRSKGASPNFAGSALQTSLFQKFAFSAAVVLLLVLTFQFGLIFKDDIKKFAGIDSGAVAGVEDSKVGLSSVKNSSLGCLANQEGKVRENISLSRVLIRAAMERENSEIK